jgi:hypothetical protein
MIDVTFLKNGNSEYVGFKTTGHAEYDDPGQDIVCAAVSALVITVVNSIETFTEDNFVLDTNQKSGDMDFHFTDEIGRDSDLLMNTLYLGISGLCESYGDYICLTFKEV